MIAGEGMQTALIAVWMIGSGAGWAVAFAVLVCGLVVVVRPRLIWGALALFLLVVAVGGIAAVEHRRAERTPIVDVDAVERGDIGWAEVADRILALEQTLLDQRLAEERSKREALELRLQELEAQGAPSAATLPGNSLATQTIRFPRFLPDESDHGAPGVVDRVDYARSGYLGGSDPLGLKVAWALRREGLRFLAPPLIANDTVFAAATALGETAAAAKLFALDAASGSPRWEVAEYFDAGTGLQRSLQGMAASAALSPDGGILCIGQGLDLDRDARLVGLDTGSGETLWTIDSEFHFMGGPSIEGNLLVAGAGAVEGLSGLPAIAPGEVIGARVDTGEVLWRYPVIDPESAPVLSRGIAFVGSGANGHAVLALRTESDYVLAEQAIPREIWRSYLPSPVVGALALRGDTLIAVCSSSERAFATQPGQTVVVGLDRGTGSILWSRELQAGCAGGMAVRDGLGVVALRDGTVLGMDMDAEGQELWRVALDTGAEVASPPALTDSHAYIASVDGALFVLSTAPEGSTPADGRVLERHKLAGASGDGLSLLISAPVVGNGRLWVSGDTAGLVCMQSGEER